MADPGPFSWHRALEETDRHQLVGCTMGSHCPVVVGNPCELVAIASHRSYGR